MVILFHFRSFHQNVNLIINTKIYQLFNHSMRFLMPQIDETKMLFHRNWTIINDNNEIALGYLVDKRKLTAENKAFFD